MFSDFRFGNLILYLWLFLGIAQTAFAQTWNLAGPYGAPGRIMALAADPRSDSVLYAAAAGGGIFKTQDAGVSWVPQLDSSASVQVCSLALDPRFPDVLYVGTGDDQSPRPGQGVARSADGGRTWTFLARFTDQPVCAVAVDPTNSVRILAGSAEGLFASSDTGASWHKVLDAPTTSIAFDGQNTVYAGTPGETTAGSRENILARSSDGGLTWTRLNLAPNSNAIGRTNWVGVKTDGSNVYVLVSYQNTTFIPGLAFSTQAPLSFLDFYRSSDAGSTWSSPVSISQVRPPAALILGPVAGSLYIAANSLVASPDYGSLWSTIVTATSEFHTAAFIDGSLLLGGEKGLEAPTLAAGTTARGISQPALGRFLGAGLDAVNGIWAAGTPGLFGPISNFVGTRIAEVSAVGNVTAAASGSSNIFAAGNSRVYKSTDGGSTFSSHEVLAEGELRAPFPPILLDPVTTTTAYVAGRRLYRTTNSGTTWTASAFVDPNPTRVVIALAMAPASRTTLYAATACLPEVTLTSCPASSTIWRSANAGTSWVQVAPVSGFVNRLAVDPRQTNTIYAAVGAFPAGPSTSAGFVPGDIVRSTNGGMQWISIRGNLPQVPVNAVIIDPTSVPTTIPGVPGPGRPGGFFNQPAQTVYIATDAGVFVSFNAGANAGVQWTDVSGNLPPTPITDLLLRQPGNTLLAATFGRGIYSTSTVGLDSGIVVDRLSVEVTLMQGDTVTTGVPLTNSSTSLTNSWRLNSLDPWISVLEVNGTLRPGGAAQVPIRVSAANLEVGTYAGRLELIAGNYVQNIFVEANVTAAPENMTIVAGNNASGGVGTVLPPLQVLLTDARQLPLPGVPVTFSISSGGGSLRARTVQTNALGVASTVLTLPPTPGTVRVTATSGDLSVTFTATAISGPTLLANSVVDAVTLNSYTPLGPGSILLISGQDLAGIALGANPSHWTTVLVGTRVVLTGPDGERELPLAMVSPTQIQALMPADVVPGVYGLRVEAASLRSNEVQILVAAFDPGIFTVNDTGRGAGIFIKEDGSVVTAANPADRGSRIAFYAAGLGAVNPPVEAGQPGASAEPFNRTLRTPRVFFDNYVGEVSYSGLAPGLVGRYLVVVRVPALLSPATNISVSMTIGGFSSNRVTIPVR